MKKTIFVFLFTSILSVCVAQVKIYDYQAVRPFVEGASAVRYNDKWGFADKTAALMIPAIYDEVTDFSEGIARVMKNKKYGYVDKTGKEVIPIIYDNAQLQFSDGMAWVCEGEKYGYYDNSGRLALPVKYEDASDFSQGLAPVQQNGQWAYIDKTGKTVIQTKYKDNPKEGRYFQCFSFCNGFARIYFYTWDYAYRTTRMFNEITTYRAYEKSVINPSYGFIDMTGKIIVPVKNMEVLDYSEGMAVIKRTKWVSPSRKEAFCGFVNSKGKEIISPVYDGASSFKEGMARVMKRDKENAATELLGFINQTGKEVIPLEYKDVNHFCNGLARICLDHIFYGFIDKTGKEVVPPTYKDAEDFSEGFACVRENSKSGYIDTTGKVAIPLEYDFAQSFSEGVAWVKLDKKWFIINKPAGLQPISTQ